MEVKTNRIEGAVWHKAIQKQTTTIVGLGATGSFVSLLLARAGINHLRLVDFDYYEIHNLGSQLADYQDIGENKARATANKLALFSSATTVSVYNDRIENKSGLLTPNYSNIVISALDSMSGRKYIFETMKSNNYRGQLLLDSRIGAEYLEVYCIPMNNQDYVDRYAETLFSDEQGNTGACNYQQSSHSACMAACEMVKLVTNWVTNKLMEDDDIPFKITHDLRTNNYGVHY
jgi:hypothetical protein